MVCPGLGPPAVAQTVDMDTMVAWERLQALWVTRVKIKDFLITGIGCLDFHGM